MVHLAVDIREACRRDRAGKGQWSYGFVSELLKRDLPLTLITDAPLPDEWQRYSGRLTLVTMKQRGVRWHWTVARFISASKDIDLYVSPTSTIVPSLLRRSIPCVPVVHDLIAFRGEPHNVRAVAVERLTLGRAVRNAVHICTVSKATSIDLLRRYPALDPHRVTPIFAGPTFAEATAGRPTFAEASHSALRATRDKSAGRTILSIGTLCPRKNQERLIAAYASLPSNLRAQVRLVLIGGRGWRDRSIVARARSTEGVEWQGYLPVDACQQLLLTATVFAFPSLYEGFGMPVLDALRSGVPVLTSDRGSLREVAGGAAVTVDPEDIASIATGLRRLLEDPQLREDLAKRGLAQAQRFTWPKTVDLFLEAINTITVV